MSEGDNPYRSQGVKASTDSQAPSRAPRRLSWLASITSSATAVYGPYGVMTLYAQIYVSCDHCKQATRNLLACAPGLLPVELAQRGLGISRQADWIWFFAAMMFALIWVMGLALLFRKRWWLGTIGAVVTTAVGAALAMALLAMIRM
jgi:hypothetical protein